MDENEDLNQDNANKVFRMFFRIPDEQETEVKERPANLDIPKKNLTSYEKKQIEYDQTSQSLGELLDAWEFIKRNDLIDEVESIKITPVLTNKFIELISRL